MERGLQGHLAQARRQGINIPLLGNASAADTVTSQIGYITIPRIECFIWAMLPGDLRYGRHNRESCSFDINESSSF